MLTLLYQQYELIYSGKILEEKNEIKFKSNRRIVLIGEIHATIFNFSRVKLTNYAWYWSTKNLSTGKKYNILTCKSRIMSVLSPLMLNSNISF